MKVMSMFVRGFLLCVVSVSCFETLSYASGQHAPCSYGRGASLRERVERLEAGRMSLCDRRSCGGQAFEATNSTSASNSTPDSNSIEAMDLEALEAPVSPLNLPSASGSIPPSNSTDRDVRPEPREVSLLNLPSASGSILPSNIIVRRPDPREVSPFNLPSPMNPIYTFQDHVVSVRVIVTTRVYKGRNIRAHLNTFPLDTGDHCELIFEEYRERADDLSEEQEEQTVEFLVSSPNDRPIKKLKIFSKGFTIESVEPVHPNI